MIVTIIGVGLIGGSLALALRDKNIAQRVIGVDNSADNRRVALERGLVDEFLPLEQAVAQSDMVVLATPVDATPILAIKILNVISPTTTVMDVGSTKQELSDIISQHPSRGRFVMSHPMWGTEHSGAQAAEKGAFVGRAVVICQRDSSAKDAAEMVEDIYTKIGMPIIYMQPEEHDLHAAYVSHISHITSFALALTVLEKEREDGRIFDLAGGGFQSTVRLAKSSAATWVPIFLKNKYNVLDVLRENIHQLQIMRKMIEQDDVAGLLASIERANSISRILE